MADFPDSLATIRAPPKCRRPTHSVTTSTWKFFLRIVLQVEGTKVHHGPINDKGQPGEPITFKPNIMTKPDAVET
jgi:hypothetical protein